MTNHKPSAIFLAVLFTSLYALPAWADKRAVGDNVKLKSGFRKESTGWDFVHLEGSREQVGYQHGYLLFDHSPPRPYKRP
jgi:hypothetical protein